MSSLGIAVETRIEATSAALEPVRYAQLVDEGARRDWPEVGLVARVPGVRAVEQRRTRSVTETAKGTQTEE
jgi:hypothetical protein